MTAYKIAHDWTEAVIAFLSENIPAMDYYDGWDHMFMSAYQMGCDALVALGQAEETDRGAARRKRPQLPEVLPRWDDICCVMLSLAGQRGAIAYRTSEGLQLPPRPLPELVLMPNPLPIFPPNIGAGGGLGLAQAAEETLHVLGTLGLIAGDRWTEAAELVLWREQPPEWDMDIAADPRFAEAVDVACMTIPADIRSEIDRLVVITEADVEASISKNIAWLEEHRTLCGANANLHAIITPDATRGSLESVRRSELDALFFRRWRISDGWLTAREANRALEIFHDPLAMMMRRAVAAQLYPDVPFIAAR